MGQSVGHLDGLVAAGGDVGDGLAALEARVRVKVLALRRTHAVCNHFIGKLMGGASAHEAMRTVGSPPASLVSTSLTPPASWSAGTGGS